MALGWFIFPYVRDTLDDFPTRYLSVADHEDLIAVNSVLVDGVIRDYPAWSEVEILGNRALSKVRGLPGNLVTLATFALERLPNIGIDQPLSVLNGAQRNRILAAMLDAGYPQAEIDERFPVFRNAIFREILRFMSRRRLKPRYDSVTDTIFVDGIVQNCGSTDDLDLLITE